MRDKKGKIREDEREERENKRGWERRKVNKREYDRRKVNKR